MPSRKRIKIKRKPKSNSEDRSRIIECVDDQSEDLRVTDDHSLGQSVKNKVSGGPNRKSRNGGENNCSKEVHIAFLPDKYESLKEESESKVKSKEEELEKRRQKYKTFRKVGLNK